jgi:hypothetical protein
MYRLLGLWWCTPSLPHINSIARPVRIQHFLQIGCLIRLAFLNIGVPHPVLFEQKAESFIFLCDYASCGLDL